MAEESTDGTVEMAFQTGSEDDMSTLIKCVARHMAGGRQHENIESLWWEKVSADGKTKLGEGHTNRQGMVEYIVQNGNASVYCPDRDPAKPGAWVHVHSNGRIKYVQTVADGRSTDNLLSLPER